MNPPFSITIEITEATQCHHAVSQLLRVFPSLSITITANERTPVTSRLTQADLESFHSYIAACFTSVYPRADPRRFRDAIDKASGSGRVGTDEAGKAAVPSQRWNPDGTRLPTAAEARAEADAIHSQNIIDCKAAAAERANAKLDSILHPEQDPATLALDRGDNHEDAGYDDTNSNGR